MQTPSLVHARARRTPAAVGGRVAPGFEEVRAEFERNFTERRCSAMRHANPAREVHFSRCRLGQLSSFPA
jgi:hypothetical protein